MVRIQLFSIAVIKTPSLKVIKSTLLRSSRNLGPNSPLSKLPPRSRRVAEANALAILSSAPVSRLNDVLSSITISPNFEKTYDPSGLGHPLPFYRNGRFVSRRLGKRRRYFRSAGFRFISAEALSSLRPNYRPLGKGAMLLDGHVVFVSRDRTAASLSSRRHLTRLSSHLHRLRKLGWSGSGPVRLTESRVSFRGEANSETRLKPLSNPRYRLGFTGLSLTNYLQHRYLGVKKNLSFFIDSWLEGLKKITSDSSIFVASYQTFPYSSPSLFQA